MFLKQMNLHFKVLYVLQMETAQKNENMDAAWRKMLLKWAGSKYKSNSFLMQLWNALDLFQIKLLGFFPPSTIFSPLMYINTYPPLAHI